MTPRIRTAGLLALALSGIFASSASALPKAPDVAVESHTLTTSASGAKAALAALAKHPQGDQRNGGGTEGDHGNGNGPKGEHGNGNGNGNGPKGEHGNGDPQGDHGNGGGPNGNGDGGDDANLHSALWNVDWDPFTRTGAALADTRQGPLYVTRADGSHRICTASVVARSTIVTAASCIRDRATGAWAKNTLFMPWINGRLVPARGGYWWGARAFTDASFTNVRNWRYRAFDYAFIRMRKPVGDRSGRFSLGFDAPVSGFVRHTGYAPDKCTVKSCKPRYCASKIGSSRQLFDGELVLLGMSCNAPTPRTGGPYQEYYAGRWHLVAVETFCKTESGDGDRCAAPGAHWGVRLGDAGHQLYNWATSH